MGRVLKNIRSGWPRLTASYRNAAGGVRSAGAFDSESEAAVSIDRQVVKTGDGERIDPHLDVSTRAEYLSNLRMRSVSNFGATR